jgi:hypothetical protein
MKHVKLFEAFSNQGKILVGFFADGGRGSHPAIIEEKEKTKITRHPAGLYFEETQKLSEMPEALLAIFDDGAAQKGESSGWIIKGISNELAGAIISTGGIDIYASDNPDSREAFALAGYEDLLDSEFDYAYSILAVIPNVEINTVYWSDNPEAGGGKLGTDYWETPYIAKPLDPLLQSYY